MTWQIRIAYRDRDEPLVTAGQRSLSPEDRATARSLILHLATDGCKTVGQALDRLEAANPAERRALLDDARAAAGLPSISTVEARAEFAALQATLPPPDTGRDAKGRVPAVCSAPGCKRFEPDPNTGGIAMVAVRKWWCPEHVDLAGRATSSRTCLGWVTPRADFPSSISINATLSEHARPSSRSTGRPNSRPASASGQRKASVCANTSGPCARCRPRTT